jgi:hypothetical protein
MLTNLFYIVDELPLPFTFGFDMIWTSRIIISYDIVLILMETYFSSVTV